MLVAVLMLHVKDEVSALFYPLSDLWQARSLEHEHATIEHWLLAEHLELVCMLRWNELLVVLQSVLFLEWRVIRHAH